MSRASIKPIVEAIPAARQKDARHYGVHPYFTRRPANVIRAYIERYSRENDVVLDPFGGTGVTGIEAMLLGRRAIHNDLNPFANFIAESIADTTLPSTAPLRESFARVREACAGPLREIEASETAANRWLTRLPLPENIPLPRTSDAAHYRDLFTPRQLAGLALLKQAIDEHSAGIPHQLLLLAWSASLAKLNKTFLSAKGRAASRGGSSIFSIYRYKVASQCVELPIWETFQRRFSNVLIAKEETLAARDYLSKRSRNPRVIDSRRDFRALACDAVDLVDVLGAESVDYVLTDPPYGAFISYLDLSILWNHWLGFPVNDDMREHEIIVGGESAHTEEHYKQGLADSIRTCFRLLRPDRWFSIIFQHWDLSYFATILETATDCGGVLKAAITQTGDVIWSMHKKKHSESVLAGEMIISFYKPVRSKAKPRACEEQAAHDPEGVLSEVFDTCLSNGKSDFSSEELYNRLVLELWRRRALGCLRMGRREFQRRLTERGWTYDSRRHLWLKNGRGQETASAPKGLFD